MLLIDNDIIENKRVVQSHIPLIGGGSFLIHDDEQAGIVNLTVSYQGVFGHMERFNHIGLIELHKRELDEVN